MYKDKQIHMIFAESINKVIGINGKLPWIIPKDMKIFAAMTEGCCVIMGRNTWESLPEQVRPLEKRQNIIITSKKDYHAPGALVFHSLEEALDHANEPIMVIGGKRVYDDALPYADIVYVSQVYHAVDVRGAGDSVVFAPRIDPLEFGVDSSIAYPAENGIVRKQADGSTITLSAPAFRFVTYSRRHKAPVKNPV